MSTPKNPSNGFERKVPERGPDRERPFPTASLFLGIAAALIALWLLATGLSQLLEISGQPASHTNIEAGPAK